MNPLAKAIAQDRVRMGLSQHELAKQLGVSQQSVSKWEEGTAVPRNNRLRQLVQTMGEQSHTGVMVSRMLAGPFHSEEREVVAVGPLPEKHQEQALHALVQAAQDIANAAQAIAQSAAHLAQSIRPPPDKPKH